MTKEQAIALAESNWWANRTARQICLFQMFEDRLCMPWSEFHKAAGEALGRPVYTHEFGLNRDGLQRELMGEQPAPTLEEIMNMIPEAKRILIGGIK